MSKWKKRELKRFATGEYELLPWASKLAVIDGHFAHRSVKDRTRVAYTPCEEHGVDDKQVSCTAKQYLETYYPSLSRMECTKLAGEMECARGKPAIIRIQRGKFGNIEVWADNKVVANFSILSSAENYCRTVYDFTDAQMIVLKRKYRETVS